MNPLASITFLSIVAVLLGVFSENVKADDPFPPYGPAVSERVTQDFFNNIINQANGGQCDGRNFYNRDAFLQAVNMYPRFGRRANPRREIAAFFAHVTHETGHFCYKQEIDGASKDYCDEKNTEFPCVPGKHYHGRGPIQISWNYNYGPAGRAIGFDGLNDPDRVSNDATVSFKTALWFWMNNVHKQIVQGQGFGATIRAINGDLECDGKNPQTVQKRINYYVEYCKKLGAPPGDNLYC
ncbi:hypothetical protein MKW92_028289 [Papaver armeniacum]|nr:hypothetical protein MKW92_028289 [Papaver armeniacum]